MNKQKITALVIGLAVVLLVVAVSFSQPKGKQPSRSYSGQSAQNSQSTTPSGSQTATTSYSLADVSSHNNAASCWTAINGGVYDLTSWVSQHPGGEGAILSICGVDGSAAFNDQHGGQRRPENILEKYKIGLLK